MPWDEGWGVGASGGESRGSAWPGRVRGSSGERQSLRGCRPEVGLQQELMEGRDCSLLHQTLPVCLLFKKFSCLPGTHIL